MSEEHNVQQDVMTSYKKIMEAVIIPENLFQNCRNKPFDIHDHTIRKLTEDKTVNYKHLIRKR